MYQGSNKELHRLRILSKQCKLFFDECEICPFCASGIYLEVQYQFTRSIHIDLDVWSVPFPPMAFEFQHFLSFLYPLPKKYSCWCINDGSLVWGVTDYHDVKAYSFSLDRIDQTILFDAIQDVAKSVSPGKMEDIMLINEDEPLHEKMEEISIGKLKKRRFEHFEEEPSKEEIRPAERLWKEMIEALHLQSKRGIEKFLGRKEQIIISSPSGSFQVEDSEAFRVALYRTLIRGNQESKLGKWLLRQWHPLIMSNKLIESFQLET